MNQGPNVGTPSNTVTCPSWRSRFVIDDIILKFYINIYLYHLKIRHALMHKMLHKLLARHWWKDFVLTWNSPSKGQQIGILWWITNLHWCHTLPTFMGKAVKLSQWVLTNLETFQCWHLWATNHTAGSMGTPTLCYYDRGNWIQSKGHI